MITYIMYMYFVYCCMICVTSGGSRILFIAAWCVSPAADPVFFLLLHDVCHQRRIQYFEKGAHENFFWGHYECISAKNVEDQESYSRGGGGSGPLDTPGPGLLAPSLAIRIISIKTTCVEFRHICSMFTWKSTTARYDDMIMTPSSNHHNWGRQQAPP